MRKLVDIRSGVGRGWRWEISDNDHVTHWETDEHGAGVWRVRAGASGGSVREPILSPKVFYLPPNHWTTKAILEKELPRWPTLPPR